MLTKARKFMIDNKLSLREKQIEDTIDRCRKKIFSPNTEDNKTTSNNNVTPTNLKFTIRQDGTETNNQRSVVKTEQFAAKQNNTEQQNNRKSTIKEDNSDQKHSKMNSIQYPKKLRHPKQESPNTSQQSSIFDVEVKKFTTVKLEENCYNKVVITHVNGPNSCYVAPFAITPERNRIMSETVKFSNTGKKVDVFKNMIYACNYERTW